MKRSPRDKAIADRMAPGVLCRDGFLGADGRTLAEIIDADRSTAKRLGVTHEVIAARLEEVLKAGMAGMGMPVEAGSDLVAVYSEAMGRIPCPWGDRGVFPKGQVELTDRASGLTVRFSPLSVHMIAEHGFYQGRGSPFRLEPEMLAEVLRLGRPEGKR